MKVTCRNQTRGCRATHNDREFDVEEKSAHIDIAKSIDNTYVNIYKNNNMKFTEVELKFYKEQYEESLKQKNNRAIAARHRERCQTIERFMHKHQPEETLLQIGNMHDNVDPDIFKDCVEQYIKELEKYNSNCHILNYAIHVDEASPHAHIRCVWDYENEKGELSISKEKALEKLGFKNIDEHRPQSRTNNKKIAFDKMMRDKWMDIAEEHGFDIDRTPVRETEPDREDMSIRQYKELMLKENLELIHELQNQVAELEEENKKKEEELKAQERQREEERAEQEREQQQKDAQMRSLQNEIEQLTISLNEAKKKVKELEKTIKKEKDKKKDRELIRK